MTFSDGSIVMMIRTGVTVELEPQTKMTTFA
jgi:hypothetical protein